jgi:hypothetical protein
LEVDMNHTARNATVADLVALLREQRTLRHDIVAPATAITARGGDLVVSGAVKEITLDGVTDVDGHYRPTEVFDEGVADKLGIPIKYLRRLRSERPDMYDANINGLLHGGLDRTGSDPAAFSWAPDPRSFMVRAYKPAEGETSGVARALLSDRFRTLDNLDVLTATLDGIRNAGVPVNVIGADLTERRMHVRLVAPQITAMAPALLAGYRSPFSGETGDANPVVEAGLYVSNSETGNGGFNIAPFVRVLVCKNGMTIMRDALRKAHVGGQLGDGVVDYSRDTERVALDLISHQTTDAVTTFLSADYLAALVADMEAKAGLPVTAADKTVCEISRAAGFTEAEADSVLDYFIQGGQTTAGGVMQAVTALAQTVDDGDRAHELAASALRVLDLAAQS